MEIGNVYAKYFLRVAYVALRGEEIWAIVLFDNKKFMILTIVVHGDLVSVADKVRDV